MNNYFLRHNYLFESVAYAMDSGNGDYIEKLGEIDIPIFKDGSVKKVKTSDIMKVVADGSYKMMRDFPYLYQFMAKCKLMYIPVYPSNVTNTMCVDEYNNLWINMAYVYNVCAMDSNRVFGILFHEMFHVFFDHMLRFNEKYPKENFVGMENVRHKANMKANICMDYEVNASMVDDGIVSEDFWKKMNGLYKKEYTGMTWEEIMHKAGDTEYEEWLKRNGFSLDDVELKLLKAIEKASKVLMDPDADEEEKRYARRQLQKEIDDILGKDTSREKSLQDELEDLQNTKLGDIGDIARRMDELIDDLHKDPAGMSTEEFEKTMSDIDKLMDEMNENANEIGEQFGKSPDDVTKDVNKSRETMKEALKKMKEGGLSKDEKTDLMDKMKDSLEDIISDDIEKDKLEKKREERDAKKEAERKERFKKYHPFRKFIILMNNFAELSVYRLVSGKTVKLCEKLAEAFEPLTELKFSEMKKDDFEDVMELLDELKESFLPDLVALIDNETILNKTEEDMENLLDGVFKHVYKTFDTVLDEKLDESAKGSVVKMAASKMRIIGKVLKTQKVWRASDDFKEAYKEEMKRLMGIYKTDGEEGLMKELIDKGAIEPMFLDDNGRKLYDKIMGK